MDLDELQSVRNRERQTDTLQELRESFYADASEYVQSLRDARDRAAERADDPYGDPEVRRLSDEIETAEGTVGAIYDRRIGKIVKKASLAAADMSTDEAGLTAEECDLFDSLVDEIAVNREHVLDMIAGAVAPTDADAREESGSETAPEGAPEPDHRTASDGTTDSDRPVPPQEPSPGEPAAGGAGDTAEGSVPAADLMGSEGDDGSPADPGGGESEESTSSGGTTEDPERVERTTVQITRDVGEILGVDERSYDLSADDVVTLPAANAGPLLERDAAEELE